MAKSLLVRAASALCIVAVASLLVGLDPFLSASIGSTARTPAVSVNRALKGDRLMIAPQGRRELRQPLSSEPSAEIPFACDPAFSPIFAPGSHNVYRRCMA